MSIYTPGWTGKLLNIINDIKRWKKMTETESIVREIGGVLENILFTAPDDQRLCRLKPVLH